MTDAVGDVVGDVVVGDVLVGDVVVAGTLATVQDVVNQRDAVLNRLHQSRAVLRRSVAARGAGSQPGQRVDALRRGNWNGPMASQGEKWVAGYVAAWESNDREQIGSLFTDDAVYEGGPDDPEAYRGREAIIDGWLDTRDEPGEWTFDWEIVSETPALIIVKGRTDYVSAKLYDNLWIVRLDREGRASHFTEWYMERKR